jgi:hypothetical protein
MSRPNRFRPPFIADTCASELTRRTNRKLSSPNPQQDTMPPHTAVPRLCITQCSVLQARVAPQLQDRPGATLLDVRAHAGFVPILNPVADSKCHALVPLLASAAPNSWSMS